MHLLQRNSPFLYGIHLQTYSGNTDYTPIFHLHNLMVAFPVVSLGSPIFLLTNKGANDSITLVQHNEQFSAIGNRWKKQVSLLQENSSHLDELVAYIKTSIRQSISFPVDSLRYLVLALFGCGKEEDAEREILTAKSIVSQWPEGVRKRVGGEIEWENQVRKLMNRKTLKDHVERELIKHKLSSFFDHELKC